MLILQRTDEWVSAHIGRPSGSGACHIMNVKANGEPSQKYKDYLAQKLAERMTHQPTRHYVTPYMQNGIDLEPEAIAFYETKTLSTVVLGYMIDMKSWVCTPDGFVDDDGILSIKCRQPYLHVSAKYIDTTIRDDDYWQAVAEMAASDRQWVDLAYYCPQMIEDDEKMHVRRIDRSAADERKFLTALDCFNHSLDALTKHAHVRYVPYEAPPAELDDDISRYLRA